MKLIYTYTHKNPDNIEPTEPITDSVLFIKLLTIFYKYNKQNLNKMTKILNHLKKYHLKEFEIFKDTIKNDNKLLEIYEKVKNNDVIKACPKEDTSNDDDDNIKDIDTKLIYQRNQELQKNLEILKNNNENLRINLDNCRNNINQINRAYAISVRRGGSNISLLDKKKNQNNDLKEQKAYINKNIRKQNLDKKLKDTGECSTFSCKANEEIHKQYKNTIELLNSQKKQEKKHKKVCKKNDKCDLCGVLKNTNNYQLLKSNNQVVNDNNDEIDYNLPLCPPDCSKCDDIDDTFGSYKTAYDVNLLKKYNKDYDISKVKFYDNLTPKSKLKLSEQYKTLSDNNQKIKWIENKIKIESNKDKKNINPNVIKSLKQQLNILKQKN